MEKTKTWKTRTTKIKVEKKVQVQSKHSHAPRVVARQTKLVVRVRRSCKMYDGREYLALVVPAKHRDAVLEINHSSDAAGHRGVEGTYQRIRKKYYFRNMLK